MRTLRSRRGSGLLVAVLALLALVAAATGAMVALVVAHAERVSRQRDGVQALYLAEMGVEEALTLAARGEPPATLRRTVTDPDRALTASPETAGRPLVEASTSPLAVGSYEVATERRDAVLTLRSLGAVTTPAGHLVTREVRVTCRRSGGRWAVDRWEQVP